MRAACGPRQEDKEPHIRPKTSQATWLSSVARELLALVFRVLLLHDEPRLVRAARAVWASCVGGAAPLPIGVLRAAVAGSRLPDWITLLTTPPGCEFDAARPAPRSLRRALLTPQINTGSLYRRDKRT